MMQNLKIHEKSDETWNNNELLNKFKRNQKAAFIQYLYSGSRSGKNKGHEAKIYNKLISNLSETLNQLEALNNKQITEKEQ